MLHILRRLLGHASQEAPARDGSLKAAITSKRKAETGLRESEDQFAKLVSGVRDYAVFLLDRDGNVLTWNTGAEHIKGYRAKDIIGRHFSVFYPSDAVSA